MSHAFVVLCLLSLLFSPCSWAGNPPKPRQIPFSSSSYGPDGPWQAVKVGLGTPTQFIDLYPGGFWESNVLNTSVCSNATLTPVCYGTAAGLFNVTASKTFAHYPETGGTSNGTSDNSNNSPVQFGKTGWGFDSLMLNETQETRQFEIPSFDMIIISEGYSQLPDGSIYTIEVGNLALGCPDGNQSWFHAGGPNINGTQLPNYLYTVGQTPSSSYGLHIGSATMGIPGSLWVGGYDQTRVLGPVSSQVYSSDWLPIDLLDISIGVAVGQSPFSFGTKSGYLAMNNASIGTALEVRVDPTVPYLLLPRSTCDAITADLPVIFNAGLGLYLWQTDDPLFTKIMSSPSMLEFTFRLNSSISQNFTINIPFSLLNLTLTAPLVDQPTPYFPCRVSPTPAYYLGRAFCQGAFIGVNWMESTNHNGVWWLAQAPGPNTPSVPLETYVQELDRYISSSANNWIDTWQHTWTPIGSIAGNTSGTNTTTEPGGTSGSGTVSGTKTPESGAVGHNLSAGAFAGIGVGVALAVFAGIFFTVFLARRRAQKDTPPRPVRKSGDEFSWREDKANAGFGPREMEGRETMPPVELDPHRILNRLSTKRYELGDTQQPAELYG